MWVAFYSICAHHFPVSLDKVLASNTGTDTKVHINISLVNQMQQQQQIVLTSLHGLQELLS